MPENLTIHEVAILGGGPAGAAAAILLARAGRAVLLIEKEPAAHDKVCGEFISWEAVHYLRQLDIDLIKLGAQPVNNLRLVNGPHIVAGPLAFSAWSLSRRILDEALLTQAIHAGVQVRRGHAVTGLERAGENWAIKMGAQSICAANVFLATGKHEIRGWRRTEKPPGFIGFKMYFQLSPSQREELRDMVEVVLFEGGYAGLELVEDDTVNLCLVVQKDIYTACGKNWPRLLIHLQSIAPQLKNRMDNAVPHWPRPLAIYNIPYGFICKPEKALPGLFRLGDQTAVIPSFAGDGISIALHSAFLAANDYLSGASSRFYQKKMRRVTLWPIGKARILSSVIARKRTRALAFAMISRVPFFLSGVVKATRLSRAKIEQMLQEDKP